jgi:hypothetical protein
MRAHPLSVLTLGFALLFAVATGFVACGGSGATVADAGLDGRKDGSAGGDGTLGDGTGKDGSVKDAHLSPDVFGGGEGGSCLALGEACMHAGDCCDGDCKGGFCNFPACQSDGLACTTDSQCCSLACGSGGTCTALNSKCGTLGNACTSSAECCSGFCSGDTCQPSSFCIQPGDACATDGDCCTGTCNIMGSAMLGTCASAPPGGPANCGLVDGELCAGTGPDGGVVFKDGGLPSCGGACCSRACAPWGPTGVLVCQPASGCHPVGDLCTTDTDCCGASGLPGGSGKPVTCDRSDGGAVGICRLPMGCKPNGDVCKLKTMSCSSSCDCCAGNCETKDTCKQDNEGVPRCADAICVSPGSSCASSADCCDGAPCVPSPSGTPPFVCSGSACVPACGACTDNGDCCPGFACDLPPASTHGTCGPCTPDAGVPDGGSKDGGTHKDAGCALYGQICTTSSQCCDGVPCFEGRCEEPPPP